MNTTEIETNQTERINLRVRLTPDEIREWMDRRYPDTNPFCDRFGFISVVYKCGHKFGLKHWSPESVTQEVHDEWVAHALSRICDDCYTKQEYPRFVFSLDFRSVEAEGAKAIYKCLKQRGYHHRGMGAWVRQFPSKKAAGLELAWIRKRGFNVVGYVRNGSAQSIVDFRTDEQREAAARATAVHKQMEKARRNTDGPPRAPRVSAW